ETIPFSCSTCHTFPQQGQTLAAIPQGPTPESHRSNKWMIDHRQVAGSMIVANTTCVNCHSQRYCENCHQSKLIHGSMLFNHAQAIRDRGVVTCAACHQQPFCARCHDQDVLQTPRENSATRHRLPARNRQRRWRKPLNARLRRGPRRADRGPPRKA
ncbi:MAG: hypothetical protein IT307_06570, partial [Chloroflexi bacterium]|nr:hypothetical protein [Chloroflexota bacterium]